MVNADKKQNLMITMLVIGMFVLLAVVCWQQVMIKKALYRENKKIQDVIIYQDATLGVQARTSKSCAEYFSVEKKGALTGTGHNKSLANYNVYLKGFDTKVWPAGAAIGFYAVFNQADYQKIPTNQLPGVPRIIEVLNSDAATGARYLTAYPINDYPVDPKLENCAVIWERDSAKK